MKPARLTALLLLVFAPAVARAYDPLTPLSAVESSEFTFRTDRHDVPARIYRPSDAAAPLPVILFSHGLGGSRHTATYLGRHWAARGYAVIFLQHPGSDSSVWEGKFLPVAWLALKRAASVENYIARAADVSGLLDILANPPPGAPALRGLDLQRVGMSGHSFGARTTQALGGEALPGGRSLADPRIRAALPMSPSPAARMSPAESFGAIKIPWFLMTGTRDGSPKGLASTTPEERREVFRALPANGKAFELVLDGAHHHAFTDSAARIGKEPRNPAHHRTILATSTAFWDAFLRRDNAARRWLDKEVRSVLSPGDIWSAN
jgi:predicted dienelactone hydrolase